MSEELEELIYYNLSYGITPEETIKTYNTIESNPSS